MKKLRQVLGNLLVAYMYDALYFMPVYSYVQFPLCIIGTTLYICMSALLFGSTTFTVLCRHEHSD